MEEERLEEAFVREWAPCTRVLGLLPPRVQAGLFSIELRLTCVDAVSEYLALGTNVGLVYWYSRKKGTIERLRCEATQSGITFVKIVSTVDYMVAAGNTIGQVSVFQIPKELPESVPDTLKRKTEPKVERYTVGELHSSQITAIEWSKNGMRLFSGDKNGVIIMTEIDFYMHLCKSVEIVNEQYEIVQISYHQNSLLVSSLYRTILCERGESRWEVNQVGKKERKSLMALGAVFQWSYARVGPGGGGAGDVAAYCARPGLRLWRADKTTDVHQTLLFKDAVANPMTVAELLNPSHSRHPHAGREFGVLHVFRDHFLLTHNSEVLYILDPRSLTAVAVVDDLRRILSVSVNKDEIFILEGERSLVRLGHAPETDSFSTGEDPFNLMTKSLSSSIQLAVSTVRELAQLDLGGLLEPAAAPPDLTPLAAAEECFELPPMRRLPSDVHLDVLESMVGTYGDESAPGGVEELQRKMALYNKMANDGELVYSRRSRRREPLSNGSTPKTTPVKRCNPEGRSSKFDNGDENGFTLKYIDTTDCKRAADESDEEMCKQIEEKEKILAKMLNLESLSIPSQRTELARPPSPRALPSPRAPPADTPSPRRHVVTTRARPPQRCAMDPARPPEELVPKMAAVPANWNLGSLQVTRTLVGGGGARCDERLSSPDGLEAEWEFV